MNVSVNIVLGVPALEKHRRQMRQVARMLTNAASSVRVFQFAEEPRWLGVSFTIPNARQVGVVDRIGRAFWMIEDYQDMSIGFGPERRRTKRSRKPPPDLPP